MLPIYDALKLAWESMVRDDLVLRDEYRLTASRVGDEWVFWFVFLPDTPGLDVTVYVRDDGRTRHLAGI